MNTDDLFAYAKDCVDNKGVFARIGHSGKLHAVRSAVSSKGSFVSKAGALVGVGFRATAACIPLPVVGSLVGAVERAFEKFVKEKVHGKRLANSSDLKNKVKFELKDLSVEELDRFRWKVSSAMEDLNKAIREFPDRLRTKTAEGARCDAYLDLAIAAQQAVRRLSILRAALEKLNVVLRLTKDWIDMCECGQTVAAPTMPPQPAPSTQSVFGQLNAIRADIAAAITADRDEADAYARTFQSGSQDEARNNFVLGRHGKCDRWCCFRNAGKTDDWKNFKDRAATVLRVLSSPFGPDDFNNNLGQLWPTQ
jgi:hypothetical protein